MCSWLFVMCFKFALNIRHVANLSKFRLEPFVTLISKWPNTVLRDKHFITIEKSPENWWQTLFLVFCVEMKMNRFQWSFYANPNGTETNREFREKNCFIGEFGYFVIHHTTLEVVILQIQAIAIILRILYNEAISILWRSHFVWFTKRIMKYPYYANNTYTHT